MCKECVEWTREIFPALPDEEMGDFLVSCTAFPFGGPDTVRDQLSDLRRKSNGDWRECYGIADHETTVAMETGSGRYWSRRERRKAGKK